MKVGDLVRIRHNEHQGFFVVISHIPVSGCPIEDHWVRILSFKDGEIEHELYRSLEVISESR